MAQPALFSGARSRLKVITAEGVTKTIAMALDVNVSLNDTVQQTYVLGGYSAAGIDPTARDVTVSFSRVIPVNQPNGSQVAADRVNGKAFGLQENINEVLTAQALTFEILDTITDKVISSIRECRFAGVSMGAGAGSVATERYNYVGIWDGGYGGNEDVAVKLGYGDENA